MRICRPTRQLRARAERQERRQQQRGAMIEDMAKTATMSREFELMAAACRWPPSSASCAEIARRAAEPVDWRRFHAIVRRQRVVPLAAQGLHEAGVVVNCEVGAALADQRSALARSSLYQAVETIRLDRSLRAEGIAPLMVKGASLAILCYGALSLKHAIDIDVLVRDTEMVAAASVLADMGYVRSRPHGEMSDAQLNAWLVIAKDSAWRHPQRGTIIELHSRLVETPALLPGIDVGSPRQTVTLFDGADVETLAAPDLYAYLCAHGAWHGWSRLKWLADLIALVRASGADIRALHAHAVESGVGRCSAQALILGETLLALELPDDLSAALRGRWVNRWLIRSAFATMAGRYEVDEHLHALAIPPRVLASHFFLRSGLRYKLAEMSQKVRNPTDRARDGGSGRGCSPSYALRGGARAAGRVFASVYRRAQ